MSAIACSRVGARAEEIAVLEFGLKLYEADAPIHDGEMPDGRRVQVKGIANENPDHRFKFSEIPDWVLVFWIGPGDVYREVWRGPGWLACGDVQLPTKKLKPPFTKHYAERDHLARTYEFGRWLWDVPESQPEYIQRFHPPVDPMSIPSVRRRVDAADESRRKAEERLESYERYVELLHLRMASLLDPVVLTMSGTDARELEALGRTIKEQV